MEVESAKVLDNGRKVVLDMKRKRAANCMAYFTGAACTGVRCSVQDAQPEIFSKQVDSPVKSVGCVNNFGFNGKRLLPKNYSNYMRSGLPQRVLFYENGEWTDFPEGFIGLVKEDFKVKKVTIEVEFRGSPSVLDFLRMVLVDLKTGLQQPIAWIDEFGNCFFPELYSVSDELQDHFQSGGREHHPLSYSEPNDTHEIKLQLEIEVTTDGNLKMEECSEGSYTHVKRLRSEVKPVDNIGLDQEDGIDVKPVLEIKEVIGENEHIGSVSPKSLSRKLTSDVVQLIFLKGMGPSVCADNIHGIQRSSGYWAQARLEIFEKQVEITEKYRGKANVRYAWLPSSKEAVTRILMHGLGFNELPKTKPSCGSGVHLFSISCSHISASYCDVDENGAQHMVLCRVILGNMELVPLGSAQSYPSSQNFDSGVNDVFNPEQYTIWNMNMSTHIYPEYVVSFKTNSSKGHASESSSKDGVSAVTNSTASGEKLPNSSPIDSVDDGERNPDREYLPGGRNPNLKFAGRPPKSAWMPFTMLFKAIEDKVPSTTMKLVYQYYSQFRNNKISRDELVQRMRWAVGDNLLRTTIISIQGNKPGSGELKVPKQEQEKEEEQGTSD